MDYEKIGNFIAQLRKKKGLTQKELAHILNVTDRAVSKWERGKGCPDISLLENLSKELDVSVIEILKGEKQKTKVNENELLYSIKYAQISMKEKIDNVINIVVITLIVLISFLLLFYNIRIHLFLEQKNYSNIFFNDSETLFETLENKINIIKTSQGNYSDDDYKEILIFVDSIKYSDIDYELYNKDYYEYQDMRIIVDNNYKTEVNKLLNSSIHKILNKYGVVRNIDIDHYANRFYDNEKIIDSFINNFYKYGYAYNLEENIGNNIKELIHYKYHIYSLILTDIINGGEIYE